MSDATARSEIIRRIAAGELPTSVDFFVITMKAGGGTCGGCGNGIWAGDFLCVIDCVAANCGPLPMHADCFLLWSEACIRDAERRAPTPEFNGATGATAVARLLPPAWHTLKEEMFCRIRLEMLNSCVRSTNEFAEAVRRVRKSGTAAAREGCELARRQVSLDREAYGEHVKDHRC